MVAEPFDVGQRLVKRILPLVARRMSATSVSRAVQHHQPLLRHGHTHSRRLSDHREGYIPQFRQYQFQSPASADLLFRRRRPDHTVAAFLRQQTEICLQQRQHRSRVVVGAETVYASILLVRDIRVAAISCSRPHRIYMPVQQQHRPAVAASVLLDPEVRALAAHGKPRRLQPCLQMVGERLLLAANGRYGDHLLQQLHQFAYIHIYLNINIIYLQYI